MLIRPQMDMEKFERGGGSGDQQKKLGGLSPGQN